MYYELHDFCITFIIFSKYGVLPVAYTVVNRLIKVVYLERTEKQERKLNSKMQITILANKLE